METQLQNSGRPLILLVDDSPENLSLLADLLTNDYQVKVANNGEKALRIARAGDPPSLILLDIMMPGMDGYEVCRQLKAEAATREMPVIFLTALADMEDERRGLDLGAVDYITKPISPPIFMARVRNHLDLKRHRDHLASLVAERTRELAEANGRLKAIDAAQQDYLRAISHELRTPANGALGIGALAIEEMADGEERRTYRDLFERSRERLIVAIDAALQLADLQSGAPIPTAPLDLGAGIAQAWETLQEEFAARALSFVPPQTDAAPVIANADLLQESLATLLKTAQRLATPGTPVVARFDRGPGEMATLVIGFKGAALSEGLQRSFFSTFSPDRTCSYVEDLGLAVPLAGEIIRAMGGTVELRNTESGPEIRLALRKGDKCMK